VHDARRVVLEGPAVAAPDLEDSTPHPGKQAPTKLARDWIGTALLAAFEVAREAGLSSSVERWRLPRQKRLLPAAVDQFDPVLVWMLANIELMA
jgi:hypothetical protein